MVHLQGVYHLLAGGGIQVAEALPARGSAGSSRARLWCWPAGKTPPSPGLSLARISYWLLQDQAFGVAHVHGLSHWKMKLGSR